MPISFAISASVSRGAISASRSSPCSVSHSAYLARATTSTSLRAYYLSICNLSALPPLLPSTFTFRHKKRALPSRGTLYHSSKNRRLTLSSVEGETKYSVVTASQLAGVQR